MSIPPIIPPWASFYFRSTHGTVPPEDTPDCPIELNPYLPWWWRFEHAELLAVGLVAAGVALALGMGGLMWLLCRWAGVPFS